MVKAGESLRKLATRQQKCTFRMNQFTSYSRLKPNLSQIMS